MKHKLSFRFPLSALVVGGLLLAGAGCGAARPAADKTTNPSVNVAAAELPGSDLPPGRRIPGGLPTPPTPPPSGPTKAFKMTAGDGKFSPDKITVDRNDLVKLEITSSDGKQHTFILDGYGIRQAVEPNAAADVSFVAGKQGTFKFNCSFHPSMTGTLEVK